MTASTENQEIVMITGASSGIGAATARELARRGFHVLAGVRRDEDADAIRGPVRRDNQGESVASIKMRMLRAWNEGRA